MRALTAMTFIAVLILPVEVALAWSVGSLLQASLVGWTVGAILVLPTVYLLFGPGLLKAVRAERDLLAGR